MCFCCPSTPPLLFLPLHCLLYCLCVHLVILVLFSSTCCEYRNFTGDCVSCTNWSRRRSFGCCCFCYSCWIVELVGVLLLFFFHFFRLLLSVCTEEAVGCLLLMSHRCSTLLLNSSLNQRPISFRYEFYIVCCHIIMTSLRHRFQLCCLD